MADSPLRLVCTFSADCRRKSGHVDSLLFCVSRCQPDFLSTVNPARKCYSRALSGLITAKGLWNGTAVVMFVLSGELLRDRLGLNTETIGLISAIFGGGLLTGNLLMPLLRRLSGTDTWLLLISLIVMSVMIAGFISGTGGLRDDVVDVIAGMRSGNCRSRQYSHHC